MHATTREKQYDSFSNQTKKDTRSKKRPKHFEVDEIYIKNQNLAKNSCCFIKIAPFPNELKSQSCVLLVEKNTYSDKYES